MDRRIFKYPLRITDDQTISMPRGTQALFVADQGGQLCLWAEVDTERPAVPTRVSIIGTGHSLDPLRSEGRYVGSVLMPPFVWHVYIQEN